MFKVKGNYLEKHRKTISAHVLYKGHLDYINPRRHAHTKKTYIRTLKKFLASPFIGSVVLFIFKYEETELCAINSQKKFEAAKLKACMQ